MEGQVTSRRQGKAHTIHSLLGRIGTHDYSCMRVTLGGMTRNYGVRHWRDILNSQPERAGPILSRSKREGRYGGLRDFGEGKRHVRASWYRRNVQGVRPLRNLPKTVFWIDEMSSLSPSAIQQVHEIIAHKSKGSKWQP